MSPTWHAVDGAGRDLATGRPPNSTGFPTPAAAVAAAPVIEWPVRVVDSDRRPIGLEAVLGAGGERVTALLEGLVRPRTRPGAGRLAELAADTPGGRYDLPVAVVSRAEAADAARDIDRQWVAVVAERRSGPRRRLVQAGRGDQLEAALHVAMLVAVEHLPATDAGVDVRAASGIQLWLLGGMVTAALAGETPDPFASWADLLGCGLWPIGPERPLRAGDPGPERPLRAGGPGLCGGRLVVGAPR